MKKVLEKKELSISKVCGLIFIPTMVLTSCYVAIGLHWQEIPSIALFYLLAMLILFPLEIGIVLKASKKEYGKYSLKSAFENHKKLRKREIIFYGAILFVFAGAMSATITPLEDTLMSPIAEFVKRQTPDYFDWLNIELTCSYSKGILLLTSIVFLVMNSIVGPIVEELFFRGYLTNRLQRFGWKSAIIISILFSLYHLWQPFQNIFRILTFGVVALITYRKKNIYISIAFHCLCNVWTSINFLMLWWL